MRSPGPSKFRFRLSRLWKKRWVRRLSFVVLPGLAVVGGLAWAAMHPAVHDFVARQRAAVVASLSDRPEFAIHGYNIVGGTPELRAIIDAAVALPPQASTLNFDVAAVRTMIGAIPAVRESRVTLDPEGILQIRISQRLARALWRDDEGGLWRIDDEGVAISRAFQRSSHPDLPLVIGEGAEKHVAQALEILAGVPDLRRRLRAFVRVGQRRWNVALDRGLTIMLPEEDAAAALSRVMAWQYGEEVLERGLAVIDMRLPERPTLRMKQKALETLRLREAMGGEAGEET